MSHSRLAALSPLRRAALPLAVALVLAIVLLSAPLPASAGSHPLAESQKLLLIRGMVAEIGVAKQAFPPGKKGIELASTGQVLNQGEVRQLVTNQGPTVRPGDRVEITKISFASKQIVLELNGGPNRTHWYDHLQVGMGGSTSPVAVSQRHNGTVVTVRFAQGIPPGLTTAQLKQMLAPVIEWNLRAASEAALGPKLPPAVKKAVQNHQVLVGMNSDMVLAAKGRADEKYHETDPKTGDEYDDWVYGHPPGDTTFVRFEGDRVIRVIDYKADGTKVVSLTPEVNLPTAAEPAATTASASGSTAGDTSADDTRPTLRRPGETAGQSGRAAGPAPIQIPGAPQPLPTTPGASGPPAMPPPIGSPGTPGSPTPPQQQQPCCAGRG